MMSVWKHVQMEPTNRTQTVSHATHHLHVKYAVVKPIALNVKVQRCWLLMVYVKQLQNVLQLFQKNRNVNV
jgi:hypothetical protein